MYQYKGLTDTIAAIATPPGVGGIGIVRVSGKEALAVISKIFQAKDQTPVLDFESHRSYYGTVFEKGDCPRNRDSPSFDEDEVIDEALCLVMRAPRSYTREDVVELSVHGGIVSVKAVLELLIENGARLAEPGEFTKRAFLNGRIDLTQAEAVLDVIQSKTEASLKVSTHQLKGELSVKLAEIRIHLMSVYTELEAIVNFPEDEIEASTYSAVQQKLQVAQKEVQVLLANADQGRLLREGIKITICGKPNVGKSSLLNHLLKVPRAIVSDIAGTTRDTIEESAQLHGVPINVVDTAGILQPRDLIEEEAVERSHKAINAADLILLMFDASAPLEDGDQLLLDQVKDKNVLGIINKIDLDLKIDKAAIQSQLPPDKTLELSVKTEEGADDLKKKMIDSVLHGKAIDEHGILLSNMRHINALQKANTSVSDCLRMMKDNTSLEFVSEEIKVAVNELDGITGKNIDEDLLDTIFSEFCIGK